MGSFNRDDMISTDTRHQIVINPSSYGLRDMNLKISTCQIRFQSDFPKYFNTTCGRVHVCIVISCVYEITSYILFCVTMADAFSSHNNAIVTHILHLFALIHCKSDAPFQPDILILRKDCD